MPAQPSRQQAAWPPDALRVHSLHDAGPDTTAICPVRRVLIGERKSRAAIDVLMVDLQQAVRVQVIRVRARGAESDRWTHTPTRTSTDQFSGASLPPALPLRPASAIFVYVQYYERGGKHARQSYIGSHFIHQYR